MPSLEEMAAWSLDEIRENIQRFLPAEHHFDFDKDALGWKARFEGPNGEKLWEENGLDERALLLSAFGWLWLREQPSSPIPGSPWEKRPGLRQQHVARSPVNEPDPADLDPDEVLAVYGYARKKP